MIKKYILLSITAGLIGYGIAEIPYYIANHQKPVKLEQSFADMMREGLEIGRESVRSSHRLERLMREDARRDIQKG